ncbi:DUF4314 domain-containing protein [Azospirillum sp. INR13]|uniref:DUF4314 domain-containing protein n=1 Tax=Azospirillum sp. INR13 TaxID=2596919 RepID=UPI00351C50B6|nr:DUF4314 domain-containing protein [Azospirillum sp. INR13]
MICPRPGTASAWLRWGPIPVRLSRGATGTVKAVNMFSFGTPGHGQIHVDWDNGRSLMLALPEDEFEIIA